MEKSYKTSEEQTVDLKRNKSKKDLKAEEQQSRLATPDRCPYPSKNSEQTNLITRPTTLGKFISRTRTISTKSTATT